jgi:hypothetical protein
MRIVTTIAAFAILAGCASDSNLNGKQNHVYDGQAQSVDPDVVTDQFVQNAPTKADVLFVISNWWSMAQAYQQLVADFSDMLQVFVGSGMDYHIGVVSTDTEHSFEQGKLKNVNNWRWVEQDTPDPINTFATMATMDATGCAGPRKPRDGSYMALVTHGGPDDQWNHGFRRDEATLHTVFVSDDKDLSTMLSFDEYVDWYNHFTSTPDIDTLSTIVDFSKDGQNLIATKEIGGSSQDIRVTPWANVLQDIGLRAQGMRTEFFLSRQPVPDTIEVSVTTPEGSELRFEANTDFSYVADRNSIEFTDFQPTEGSVISLKYTAL